MSLLLCLMGRRGLTRFSVLLLILLAPLTARADSSDLDDLLRAYVAQEDTSYHYTVVGNAVDQGAYSVHLLQMTSQQWRGADELDRPLWTHSLAIVVPKTVLSAKGMLFISGGSNVNGTPVSANEFAIAAQIAVASGSVVALLGQVPNQPLLFADASAPLSEDALIAYSWDKAMATGDYSWAAYLPMTKATVRAMDTVQEYLSLIGGPVVNQFVVTGFSKRAAPVWLAATVDPRVVAIAPGVFDFLDMATQVELHFAAYGFFTPAASDYVTYDIVSRLRIPEGQRLLQLVDPLSYRDRITVPMYLINSPGDQFFTPDSAKVYFDKLPNEKLLRYVPNTDHSLSNAKGDVSSALTGLLSWYLTVLYDVPRPAVQWDEQAGLLTVFTDQQPSKVLLWQASNPSARDFRRESIGPVWRSTVLSASAAGTYTAFVPVPSSGWAAYFIELEFPGLGGVPQTYSTRVYITPDHYPFALSEPVSDPQGVAYWRHQFRATRALHRKTLPSARLAAYFPFPLFDRIMTQPADAAQIFTAQGSDAQTRAMAHCLAVRLNVADARLGWYSRLRSPSAHEHEQALVWQYWNRANSAFADGAPEQAGRICHAINHLALHAGRHALIATQAGWLSLH